MPYEVKINTFQKQGNRLGENQSTKSVTRIWEKVAKKSGKEGIDMRANFRNRTSNQISNVTEKIKKLIEF